MSTLITATERIAAAGCSRAVASFDVVGAEHAGSVDVAAAAFRGWGSNPTSGMQAKATKRHDLTPAPRPEEASP